MTLLELADLVADLIKKHGTEAKVGVTIEQLVLKLDGTYLVRNQNNFITGKVTQILLRGE